MTHNDPLLARLKTIEQEMDNFGYESDGACRTSLIKAIELLSKPPKLCGTCKHWGRHKDAGRMFRVCLAIEPDLASETSEHSDSRMAQVNPKYHAETLAFRENHQAVVYGDDAYNATFRTKASFSCNLHSPKEPT